MNIDFRRLLYIIVITSIIFLIGALFIHILPWLILIGAVSYIVFKIKSFIKLKKIEKHNAKNIDDSNNYNNMDTFTPDDDYTGEIIDVDYEETDNKE